MLFHTDIFHSVKCRITVEVVFSLIVQSFSYYYSIIYWFIIFKFVTWSNSFHSVYQDIIFKVHEHIINVERSCLRKIGYEWHLTCFNFKLIFLYLKWDKYKYLYIFFEFRNLFYIRLTLQNSLLYIFSIYIYIYIYMNENFKKKLLISFNYSID